MKATFAGGKLPIIERVPEGIGGWALAEASAGFGGVAEWLKAHAWKVCIRETVSRVRIPPPPPVFLLAAVKKGFSRISQITPAFSPTQMVGYGGMGRNDLIRVPRRRRTRDSWPMHLTLTVDTVTNEVASHARQTQALTPPQGEIKISIDCGPIHKTGVKPDTQLTSLLGRATALRPAQGAPRLCRCRSSSPPASWSTTSGAARPAGRSAGKRTRPLRSSPTNPYCLQRSQSGRPG